MLSILLPIYNFNCLPLVTDLLQQCEAAQIIFEIIALEDASTQYLAQNSRIKKLSKHITYERLSQNIGRSSIRNLLAEKAKYEYLLFLDCDSAVVNNQYIQNYIKALNSNQLLYGGRVYRAQAPENKQLILHWKFGKYREQIPA
ncbi:MAG: glycosyltransferase, partial [Bacteroidota bacterium]